MEQFTKVFYNDVLNKKYDYEKIKLTSEAYNQLPDFRLDKLVETFGGYISGEDWREYNKFFCLDFPYDKAKKNYQLYVLVDIDYNYLYLCSTEEDKSVRDNDRKDIEAWFKKHNIFDGFGPDDSNNDDLCRYFKFPSEEKEFYSFTENLIKLLNEDVTSIFTK